MHGLNNNVVTTKTFFLHLFKMLDYERPNWRQNTIIMLDNAAYHKTKAALEFFKAFKVPILFTAPYSYSLSPIEMLFSFVKAVDLRDE